MYAIALGRSLLARRRFGTEALDVGQIRVCIACPVPRPWVRHSRPRSTMTTGTIGEDEGLLTERDTAGLLEVSLSTLRRWKREGTGPPCLEIGRQVRYRRAAIERWLTGSIQTGSPDENR
jgi:predicted DNA-binding transcriptional regulator AlpA